MNLGEIRRLLKESNPEDWSKIDSSGPLYKNGFSTTTSADDTWIEAFWHHSLVVYREDVDLTIQWGYGLDPHGKPGDWHFAWADRFMNKNVRPFWVDVFWRGSLVDRYALVGVDGAHGLVPMPSTAGEEPDWYDVVTEREVAVAELIGALGSYSGPVNYVQAAGFTIVPDED